MEKSIKNCVRQLIRVVNKITVLEKTRIVSYDKGQKLYPSEIHLMLLIYGGAFNNSKEMAENLGVTKGAVSQTISRLVQKGILLKRKHPENRKELEISFTPKGEEMALLCYRMQLSLRDRFTSYFQDLPGGEQKAVRDFLTFMEEALEEVVNNRAWTTSTEKARPEGAAE